MFKEALIWAGLIAGLLFSSSALQALNKNKKYTAAQAIAALFFVLTLFFCGIYLVFRFFAFLYKVSIPF